MATKAEKALAACRKYDQLASEIAKNTKDIGLGFDACDRIVTDKFDFPYIPDGKTTHLAEAFEPFVDDDGSGYPTKEYRSPEEIAEIIGDCEGCRKAYEAITARKENRKKLAAVKRTIRTLGREA